MSAYTRHLTDYEPVLARVRALNDEIDKIDRELRWSTSALPELSARRRAKVDEVEAVIDEIEQALLVEMPEPTVGDGLRWAVRDFVTFSPYFPAVVALVGFVLLFIILALVIL